MVPVPALAQLAAALYLWVADLGAGRLKVGQRGRGAGGVPAEVRVMRGTEQKWQHQFSNAAEQHPQGLQLLA